MKEELREKYIAQITDVDSSGQMTIFSVAQYVQIVSTHDAVEEGMDFFHTGDETEYYWVVARIKYSMTEYPNWREGFEITTYIGGCDKLFGVRLFDILNNDGHTIGHVIVDYILLDAKKHRPVNLKKSQFGGGEIIYEGEKLEKLAIPQQILKEDIRKAYYSELDVNKHMNNTMYIKWILDIISLEVLAEFQIESLQINYNTSVMYGDEVRIVLGKNSQGDLLISGTSLDGKTNYFISEVVLRSMTSEE